MNDQLPLDRLPTRAPGPGFTMLDDVTVLDLTTSIAGPYATMLLSDFGAQVIKIERPGGDDARHWGPPFLDGDGLWFLAVNRNKKSVVLDSASEEGRAQLLRLAERADVVVTNQPPSVQEKLGLTHEDFRKVRPDVIFTAVTGFGLDGARRNLTCYDIIAEGYSGVMDLTGAEGGEPQKVGTPAADLLAGQDAAMATLAALYERKHTGKGRVIDISMVESMSRFLSCRITSYLGSGEVPRRSGGKDSVIAIYQTFETADELITLGLGSDAIWKRFWAAVGDPDYAEQPGVTSNAERRAQRSRIVGDIQKVLAKRPRSEWLELFASARVPAGPINRVDEVAADKHLHDRGFLFTLDDDGRKTPQVGLGIRFDGEASVPRAAPPKLGADTDDVLKSLDDDQ